MSEFKFQSDVKTKLKLEFPFTEHAEELKQRIFYIGLIFLILSLGTFINIKPIVEILKQLVNNIKFFQLSPSEYFFSSIKIALYIGILLTSPFFLIQLILFIRPGLNKNEIKLIFPLLIVSITLCFISIIFSYKILIPTALQFFISYNSDLIEPLWSFNKYFDFILVLFYTTGIAFQIPIVQIIFGILGIISGEKMLSLWKYIVILATIISAILTPSTDPITQLLLTGAILFLYLTGAGIVKVLES